MLKLKSCPPPENCPRVHTSIQISAFVDNDPQKLFKLNNADKTSCHKDTKMQHNLKKFGNFAICK
ncbi:hypothetical protein T4D_12318 [Trichinella pseudospiralis]|uniref:Uncharacterized protein n=1 Tax=Trichinella pseudospiralis TaxID=6337 RepID=A0A0V1FAM4_TRIPS|nr:hypothetical protein T4D_12318 [Trichinella pseudospiralis]